MSDAENIEAAERVALMTESALPAPDSPERERLAERQSQMVAGLLAGYRKYREAIV